MKTLVDYVGRINNRVQVLERRSALKATDNSAALTDNVGQAGVFTTVYNQASSPTGLNFSTDIGSEWINSGTSAVSWWDGLVWQSGAFPYATYDSRDDVGALGPGCLVRSRTFLPITMATTAPGSPATFDLWKDTSSGTVWKIYNGSSFVAIGDTTLTNALQAMQNQATGNRVNFAATAPGTFIDWDVWFDTDDWSSYTRFSSVWNLMLAAPTGSQDGKIITASTFRTAATGQRMEMASDTAGGVIKFWTATPDRPGYFNPTLNGSIPVIRMQSPTSSGFPSPASIEIQSGTVSTATNIAITGGMSASENSAFAKQCQFNGQTFFNADLNLNTGVNLNMTGSSGNLSTGGGNVNTNGGALQTSGGNLALAGGSIVGSGTITVTTADINVNGSGASVNIPNCASITSASNNLNMNTANGKIRLVGSAAIEKRFKEPITLEQAKPVLDAVPVTWLDRQHVKEFGKEGSIRFPGWTMEEMDKKAPMFAAYQEGTHKLEGVLYDRIPAAHNVLIKDLYGLVEKLTAEVGALQEEIKVLRGEQ